MSVFSRGGSRIIAAFIVLCCVILNLTPHILYAQQSTLLLSIHGDIWAWAGGKAQQRTNWGHNGTPFLSPGGSQITYKSLATLAVDAVQRVGPISGDLPANIWILDVPTNNAVRVVDQPSDALFMTPNVPDKYILRSDPAWSPDGSAVAWTELSQDGSTTANQTVRLVVYTLDSKTSRVIADNIPQAAQSIPTPLKVEWGVPGLAVENIVATPSDPSGVQDTITVYDTSGKRLSTAPIARMSEFGWIRNGAQDTIAVLANDEQGNPGWLLMDPLSGAITEMSGVPEMYSTTAPDGLSLYVGSMGSAPNWQIAAPGQQIARLGSIDDVFVFSQALAIAPDGQSLAYVKGGDLFIYTEGAVSKVGISDVASLAWGSVGWRVRRLAS